MLRWFEIFHPSSYHPSEIEPAANAASALLAAFQRFDAFVRTISAYSRTVSISISSAWASRSSISARVKSSISLARILCMLVRQWRSGRRTLLPNLVLFSRNWLILRETTLSKRRPNADQNVKRNGGNAWLVGLFQPRPGAPRGPHIFPSRRRHGCNGELTFVTIPIVRTRAWPTRV